MSATAVLNDEAQRLVGEIGQADLVVGIPSFNNASTIGHVAAAAAMGLAKYFPDRVAVLVNSDGGSSDGTPEVVARLEPGPARTLLLRHAMRPVRKLVTAYQGIPGKGSAFRTIFEIARRLDARACAVVDADLRSVTPEWFELLLGPVLQEGYEFVAPLYSRHKYDGTITNAIVYPLVRSLYGKRIRQPIGGDFGMSGKLAAHYADQDAWHSDVARFGIDIWMTTTALVGGFRVCQAYLGAKIHDAKDPGAHLANMLVQVTGSLFAQIEAHEAYWSKITGSEAVPEFGFRYHVGLEPVNVNLERMRNAFRNGVREFAPLYAEFLEPDTRARLQAIAQASDTTFALPADLWVRVVYEFVLAFHARRPHPDHLLRTLTPLYLGRTASWVCEAADYSADDVENALDDLSRRFEDTKPAFLRAWQEGRFLS
ncbi:MAG TPA: glycosyl transferase family 2 [Candidatus Eisenbacteria bacterium]|nr:glycosyl transferase family 2 [Candidatus Eisenbacteria bacterium]